jgi:hypothetical protein
MRKKIYLVMDTSERIADMATNVGDNRKEEE